MGFWLVVVVVVVGVVDYVVVGDVGVVGGWYLVVGGRVGLVDELLLL